MAMVETADQRQSHNKYHCRICRKAFGCGRALGGHMRAHGINDNRSAGDADDDPSAFLGEWDDKLSPSARSSRMYALRANPSRHKTTHRACENCGEEFFSWKAFLDHGKCKCTSDADPAESMVSSPTSDVGEEGDPAERQGCTGWWKGKKRSRRGKLGGSPSSAWPSSEEEDLANCLVMLSAARVPPAVAVDTEESCGSAHKEEEEEGGGGGEEEFCWRRNPVNRTGQSPQPAAISAVLPRGMFECKACGKAFTSHQALGGHRASHKRVRGCFAAKLDDYTTPEERGTTHSELEAWPLAIVPYEEPSPKKESKVHECSICHRMFTSGQALGGHKRCHWMTSNSSNAKSMSKLHQRPHLLPLGPVLEISEPLDLNLPPPVDGVTGARTDLEAPLSLRLPSSIFPQPWTDSTMTKSDANRDANHNSNATFGGREEGGSKIKRAKLSNLGDLSKGCDNSTWLQVGIGSSARNGEDRT